MYVTHMSKLVECTNCISFYFCYCNKMPDKAAQGMKVYLTCISRVQSITVGEGTVAGVGDSCHITSTVRKPWETDAGAQLPFSFLLGLGGPWDDATHTQGESFLLTSVFREAQADPEMCLLCKSKSHQDDNDNWAQTRTLNPNVTHRLQWAHCGLINCDLQVTVMWDADSRESWTRKSTGLSPPLSVAVNLKLL